MFGDSIKGLRENTIAYNNYKLSAEDYLVNQTKVLSKAFENKMGDNYIFSNIFFVENGDFLTPKTAININTGYSDEKKLKLEEILQNGQELVENGECIGLTDVIVNRLTKEPIQSLVFFRKDKKRKLKNYSKKELISADIFDFYRGSAIANRDNYSTKFLESADALHIDDNELYRLYRRYETFYNLDIDKKNDFFIYFIKPYSNHIYFGSVYLLGVKKQLKKNDFHYLRLLIHRITSEIAIDKFKIIDQLMAKTSFSVTSHSLKTQINSNIKTPFQEILTHCKEKHFKDHKLNIMASDLYEEILELRDLTGVLSLVDKKNNSIEFQASGKNDSLLQDTLPEHLNLKIFIDEFNTKNPSDESVVLSGKSIFQFEIKLYESFASNILIKLLLNTILENILKHGKAENGLLNLNFEVNSYGWKFWNKSKKTKLLTAGQKDYEQLKGNLSLFNLLINERQGSSVTKNKKFNYGFFKNNNFYVSYEY